MHCTVARVTEHLDSVDLLFVSTRLAQRSSSSQMQLQPEAGRGGKERGGEGRGGAGRGGEERGREGRRGEERGGEGRGGRT